LKKQLIAISLVFVLILSLFTGCSSKGKEASLDDTSKETTKEPEEKTDSQESKEEMVLNFCLPDEPRTLDPTLNSQAVAGNIINNIYEGLMREVDGKLVPAIAENYEVSDDGLKYTFHLKDTKWSDGKPLTAHDFKYTWLRALDPETASDYAMLLFYIKGGHEFFSGEGKREDVAINAIDNLTLEVELQSPTPYFLNLTSFYTYLPVRQDIVEKDPEGWATNTDILVTNGPFKLTKYASGDTFVLEKNENYWNMDKVKLDRINANILVNESTALMAYQSGDIDIMSNIPTQEIPILSSESDEFYIKPKIGTYFYVFNNSKAPTNDVNVRKALNLAIDRKQICENVTKGAEVPATTYVPPGLKDTRGNEFSSMGDYGVKVEADVEKAKEYLAKAGFPNGEDFPQIEILYNTSETHKIIAEAIQEMWKKNLNIEVTITNQEWPVFASSRRYGEYTGAARFGWFVDYADAMSMLEILEGQDTNNSAQWMDEEYNNLLLNARNENDPEKRDEALYAAEKILFDQQVIMPIFYYTDKFLVNKRVVDWQKESLGNWFFGYTYIDNSK
jgi:oligopeptide transport system substrate-binding protein